jgi:hypothetical protein
MEQLKAAVVYCLQAITSNDNQARIKAEQQLQQFTTITGYGLCLTQLALDDQMPPHIRQVSRMVIVDREHMCARD